MEAQPTHTAAEARALMELLEGLTPMLVMLTAAEPESVDEPAAATVDLRRHRRQVATHRIRPRVDDPEPRAQRIMTTSP